MFKWLISASALCLATASYGQSIVSGDTKEGNDLLEAFASIQAQGAQQNLRFASVPAIPSAMNSAHGTVFMSLTYANPRGGVAGAGGDGDAAIGFAVGNADDGVSFQVTANITGLEPFADDGYLSVQASSAIDMFANPTYVGLTVANLAGWGGSAANDETASIQMTQNIAGDIPIQWTVGLGTGVRDDKASGDQFGGFAGVGFGVADGLSIGASTNFDKFNVGATYMVNQVPGLSLSLTSTDVAGRRGEPVTSVSVGYSFAAF